MTTTTTMILLQFIKSGRGVSDRDTGGGGGGRGAKEEGTRRWTGVRERRAADCSLREANAAARAPDTSIWFQTAIINIVFELQRFMAVI